ncbi:MAG: PPK2 family polyphosphate kinase [Actinomycetota bacterium]
MATTARERFTVEPGTPARLGERDPHATPGVDRRRDGEREAARFQDRLAELQERLVAEGTRSLLVVLQGMDTSGKDGAIKHAFASLSPSATRVRAFRAPTPEELEHDFLWRIRRALPEAGQVGIFNRSHYEDVVVVRVKELVPPDVWAARYEQINAFERELAGGGTTIVKVFLHISKLEQRSRLLARLEDPTKRWKFNPGDLDDRERWDAFQEAYEDALTRCSTEAAPWHVIPADRKWYRNWALGALLVETLEAMDPRYPEPGYDVEEMKARLATDASKRATKRSDGTDRATVVEAIRSGRDRA